MSPSEVHAPTVPAATPPRPSTTAGGNEPCRHRRTSRPKSRSLRPAEDGKGVIQAQWALRPRCSTTMAVLASLSLPQRSPPRLLTGAACGGLGSPPARRARRANLHHWHSTGCAGDLLHRLTLLSGRTSDRRLRAPRFGPTSLGLEGRSSGHIVRSEADVLCRHRANVAFTGSFPLTPTRCARSHRALLPTPSTEDPITGVRQAMPRHRDALSPVPCGCPPTTRLPAVRGQPKQRQVAGLAHAPAGRRAD
jgi:hypothetical protein